ncbi:hypothetical protein TNCV_4844801 [Trichonephila clavipes]|uniref:Uncharacterized protein n=1 Tax=Trichonephila clavipes TaxID=2585209 RepID=A0A8X7BM23_TRICX|nr:hypothetical protein TNCV_4844801 [Trichonephila clavipes]
MAKAMQILKRCAAFMCKSERCGNSLYRAYCDYSELVVGNASMGKLPDLDAFDWGQIAETEVLRAPNEWPEETSLDCEYLTPTAGWEYGVRLTKPWILHARMELHKGMMAQSWFGVFFVALFGMFDACTNLPQCNSVRTVVVLSPPSVCTIPVSSR